MPFSVSAISTPSQKKSSFVKEKSTRYTTVQTAHLYVQTSFKINKSPPPEFQNHLKLFNDTQASGIQYAMLSQKNSNPHSTSSKLPCQFISLLTMHAQVDMLSLHLV